VPLEYTCICNILRFLTIFANIENYYILSKFGDFFMSRKERRAKARRERVENLHRPVKANNGVLIAVAVATVVVVVATYFIRYSNY
jgi:hypothetical protein